MVVAESGPKSVSIVVDAQNTQWDPIFSGTEYESPQLDMFYDTLMRKDAAGESLPELAESWSFNADGLLLNLRPGVVFQDGTPFNAEAVKINLDRARGDEKSTLKGELSTITDVIVVDEFTVQLVMDSIFLPIVSTLCSRPGMMASPTAIAAGTLGQTPVGAGPFKMGTMVKGVKHTAEKWDGYWNPEIVGLDTILVTAFIDESTRLNGLRTGIFDLAMLKVTQVQEAESAGLKLVIYPLQTVTSLQIASNNIPCLVEPLCVQAMMHAIDRESIVKNVLNGLGVATEQYFPPGTLAHDPELKPLYPYDVAKAKALMAEAGFPDGFSFKLNYGSTPSIQELEAIQGMLALAGITMTIEQLPGSESIKRMWFEKTGQAVAIPGNSQSDPSLSVGYFLAGNVRNPGGYENPKFMKLYQKTLVLSDPVERKKALQAMSRELTSNPYSVIPLYTNTGVWGSSEKVVGFQPFAQNIWQLRGVTTED